MKNKSTEAIDIRFLFSALILWIISAAILLPIATLGAQFFSCGEKALAYISSAASFLTAMIAGAKAMRIRKRNAVYTAIVTAVCIIILALTIGFVVAGNRLEADGILSVVTFTLAGSLVGAVFFQEKKRASKKPAVSIRTKSK